MGFYLFINISFLFDGQKLNLINFRKTVKFSNDDYIRFRSQSPSGFPALHRAFLQPTPGSRAGEDVACAVLPQPCVDGKDFLLALTELRFLPLGSQAVVHSSSLVPAARRPLAGWPALTVPQETQRLFWALLPECTSSRHLPVPHPTIGSIRWLLDPDGLQDLPRSLWLLPKRESRKSSAPVDFQI